MGGGSIWLNPVFYGIPVRESQIVQEVVEQLRVLVVPAPGFDTDASERIVERLRARVGDVDIRVETVESIPRTGRREVPCGHQPPVARYGARAGECLVASRPVRHRPNLRPTCSAQVGASKNRVSVPRMDAEPNRGWYSWFNPAHLLAMQEIERSLVTALVRHGRSRLDNVTVLDVGCGTGAWLREFIKLGARPEHLSGVDLVAERIAEAEQLCPASVTLQCGNAASLNFQNGTFDLVLQSMLFTSVLDPQMRRSIAAEMLRVTSPDGLILWYDYHVNNPRNADVRAVSKREIRSLFPGCDVELQRITLAPPISRAIAPRSRAVWRWMNAVPWLRTHYLGVIRRARES